MEENQSLTAAPKEKKAPAPVGYILVGVLVLALAVVGAAHLVTLAVSHLKENATQREQEEAAVYNGFLTPAAAIDIAPFDDVADADAASLLSLAVWSVLYGENDPGAFSYADDGSPLLPVSLVEQAFTRYFGPTVAIQHGTVEGYGYAFTYDPSKNAYRIPLTTITPIYTPRVTEVVSRGDAVVLTCGFVNAAVYEQDPLTGELKSPEPEKFLKITLRGPENARYISSVQNLDAPETVSFSRPAATGAANETTEAADTTGAEETTAGPDGETAAAEEEEEE